MILEKIKTFFYYSRSERRSTVLLSSLVLLALWLPTIVNMIIPEKKYDLAYFRDAVMKLEDSAGTVQEGSGTRIDHTARYRPSVGYTENHQTKNAKSNSFAQAPLELNTSDSLALVGLSGIGPVFAHRILAFRERLGGYHSVEQLHEIYGMKPEQFERLRGFFTADATKIQKLSINNAGKQQLGRHPYIGYQNAAAILRFRARYGEISEPEDLLKAGVLNDSTFKLILPYLVP